MILSTRLDQAEYINLQVLKVDNHKCTLILISMSHFFLQGIIQILPLP